MGPRAKTPHQARIELFMQQAGRAVPPKPCIPSDDVLLTRVRLILEEALETIEALGYEVDVTPKAAAYSSGYCPVYTRYHSAKVRIFELRDQLSMPAIVKELSDLSVVTIGTLSAMGIADEACLQAVDANNLAKTIDGPLPCYDGTSKFIKPPGHKPPDIRGLLEAQLQAVE